MKPAISLAAFLSPLLAVGMMYAQQEKPPAPPDEPSTPEASKQFNDDKVAELSKLIAGKEDQPAEAVFKEHQDPFWCACGKAVEDYADRL